MNDLFLAINKFCYESLNFESVRYEWKQSWNKDRNAVYVPRFITEVKWRCDTDHIVSKWLSFCNESSFVDAGVFIHFYASLDLANQDLMAEWIINNGTHGSGR